MIIREIYTDNPLYKGEELECEETGIRLQKISSTLPNGNIFLYVVDNGRNLAILDDVFEIIKSMMR